MTTQTLHYPSLHALAHYLDASKDTPFPEAGEHAREFTRYMDYPQAVEIVRHGGVAPQFAKKIATVYLEIPSQVTTTHQRHQRHVYGSTPHIPAYVANSPRCMTRLRPRDIQAPPKSVKIGALVSKYSDITTDPVIKYGAAILAVINALQQKNIKVELSAITAIKDESGNAFINLITIKPYNASISTDTLSFTLCHPGFNRLIMFRHAEVTPERCHIPQQSYGYPFTPTPKETNLDIITPEINNEDYDTPQHALATMTASINSQLKGLK